MKTLVPLLLACALLPAAFADEQKPAAPAADAVPPLSTANEWLALQASGAARGAPNPVPGEALEAIYQRYLNSFAAAGAAPQAR